METNASQNGAPKKAYCLEDEINKFVDHTNALGTTLPILALMTHCIGKVRIDNFNEMLTQYGELDLADDTCQKYAIDPIHEGELERRSTGIYQAEVSQKVLPRIFIVALVSQFDFFVGRLMRCLYRKQPALLQTIESEIQLSQLLLFDSIEAAKEH